MKLSMMSYERMQPDVSKQQNFSHRLGQILFSLVSLFSRHPIIIVTRPRVDKVKPKGWFKNSLQLD